MGRNDDDEDLGGVEYKGLSGVARNSKWLDNSNIPHDRDTRVVIEKVYFHDKVKFPGQGKVETNRFSLKFKGSDKRLLANSGHRQVLNRLFTTDVSKWWGKAILLYVDHDVRKPGTTTGEKCSAIRIRPMRVDQSAPTPELQPIERPADPVDADFEAEAKRLEGQP